jgi:uncharacterized membrane protein YeaQ/YmgE (transglycosylase-associated protein family)
LANSSPGFERSENPGSQEQEEQTLKALGLCDINPYRVESMAVAIFPGLSLPLQPWAEISERLRRYSDRCPRVVASRSNPGLELVNAVGVFQTEPRVEIRFSFCSTASGLYNPLHMTLFDLLILLLVAGICGALGQAITGFSRGGCLVSIALGFVGAVVGMWLSRALGLPELFAIQIGTTNFPIVWSIIGSALFVAVIALLTRRYY